MATTRAELEGLLRTLNDMRERRGEGPLEFYITNPGDWRGKRYQLMRQGTGSNVSYTTNAGEMAQILRTVINLG